MLKLQFNDDLTLTEQQIVLTLTTPKATVYFPVRYVFSNFSNIFSYKLLHHDYISLMHFLCIFRCDVCN